MSEERRERERRLVHSLAVALRTASLFQPQNQAVESALAELLTVIDEGEGATTLTLQSRCIFVDEERVRMPNSEFLDLRTLISLFERWGIAELMFFPGLEEPELRAALYLLMEEPVDANHLRARLRSLGAVHVDAAEAVDEPAVTRAGGATALHTYAACVDVSHELHEAIRGHTQIRTRRLRRVTQAVVDMVLKDEQALFAMTTIKEFDDYLFTHSANVAILAVGLGTRLGLDKATLGELCLAAFLHDVGKVQIPRDILEKPGPLDEEEWARVRRHPSRAVHVLLEQQHLSPSLMRAAVAAFEHHLDHDLTGYPQLSVKSGITLFGRLIMIADRYDAMTTPRSYRKRNLTPYEGICHLLANSGRLFDPVLVQVFLETVGLYPPGTVVGLKGGEVAVVQRPPLAGQPIDRPQVRVLRGPFPGSVIDLAEELPDGSFRSGIEAVYNAANMGQVPAVEVDRL